MTSTVCPGCDGTKSRRAKLCRICRRRANVVGAKVWTESAIPQTPSAPRTSIQSRIYYGKCAALARNEEGPGADKEAVDRRMRDVKVRTLEYASSRFRREIESSTELSEIEMDIVCEHLDHLLRQFDVAPA